jgi:crossover junction endodeoxyribonuclease RuvC
MRNTSATPYGAATGGDAGATRKGAVPRVLGVDPGTVALGWGIIEGRGQQVEHVASGVIRARGTRAERLAEICDVLSDICARFGPTALSLEQTFVGDNIQSAFRLGEARGAVMVAACRARLQVAEYSPAEIKVAVAGSGRATKAQMQTMVARLLGVPDALAADEADALGAAICHLQVGQFATLVAGAPGWGGRTVAGRTGSRDRRRPAF